MKTLLVWQSVPESVNWYVLDALSADDLRILGLVHGSFINDSRLKKDVEDALGIVSARLTSPKSAADYDSDWQKQHAAEIGRWFEAEVQEHALPTIGPIDKVFTCGFLL